MKTAKGIRVSMALLLAFALSLGGVGMTIPQAYAEPAGVVSIESSDLQAGVTPADPSEEAVEEDALTVESPDTALLDEAAVVTTEEEIAALAVSPTGDIIVDTVVDLIDAVNNASENRTVELTAAFQADMAAHSGEIVLSNTSGHTIAVDGRGLALAQGGTSNYFKIENGAGGTLIFNNMNFDSAPKSVFLIGANTGTIAFDNLTISGNGAYAIDGVKGTAQITNSEFLNGKGGVATAGPSSSLQVSETLFQGNTAARGAAMLVASNTTTTIVNSSFIGNSGQAGGYSGGAIAADQASNVNMTIEASYFEGNQAPPSNGSSIGGHGGAISIYRAANSNFKVSNSYFKGNLATQSSTSRNDGGAISVVFNDASHFGSAVIEGSTFENNMAADDGGAILFEGNSLNTTKNLTATVTNSTFVGNIGQQKSTKGLAGGAVQLYGSVQGEFTSNTFYKNEAQGSGSGGGAIGFGGYYNGTTSSKCAPSAVLKDNVFAGNTAKSSKYNNVSGMDFFVFGSNGLPRLSPLNVTSAADDLGNVGLDAGVTLPAGYSVKSVFGTETPTLQANGSVLSAGISTDSHIIPTLMIAPRATDGTLLYADGSGKGATAVDERGAARDSVKPDAGAVDIGWIALYANGGTWDDSIVGDFDSTRMISYVDPSSVDGSESFIAFAGDTNSVFRLPSSSVFSDTPEGATLVGWSMSPTTRSGDGDVHAIGDDVVEKEAIGESAYYAVWDQDTEKELNVARLFGSDRYSTSHQVSTYERDASSGDTVILASGWDYNFPDALTSSTLSAYYDNAPIVLTGNDVLAPAARDAIVDDLAATHVIIVGSTAAINQDVEDTVADLPNVTTVERVGGVDRQETAEMIFDYLGADHSSTAIIARSGDFPDSLTISPWAAATKSPIFLTESGEGSLTAETKAALATGGFDRIMVLGDENATPAIVYDQAMNAAGLTDADMVRLGGINRYETSSMVAEWVTSSERPDAERLTWEKPAIARGDIHADSLTGGALQGRDRSVILLTPPTFVSEFAEPLVKAHDGTINEIRFFGDENAVSFEVTKDFITMLTYTSILWKPDTSVIIPGL